MLDGERSLGSFLVSIHTLNLLKIVQELEMVLSFFMSFHFHLYTT